MKRALVAVFTAAIVLALICGYSPVNAATAQPNCCTGTVAAPTPPTALLAFSYFYTTGSSSCSTCGLDPGSTALQALWWGGETQTTNGTTNSSLTGHCPGRTATDHWASTTASHCQFYFYDGWFRQICPSAANGYPEYYNWQHAIVGGSDETAADHYSPSHGDGTGGLTSTNRFVSTGESGTCNSTGSGYSSGSGSDLVMNPADSTADACLYTYLTTNTSGAGCSWGATGPFQSISTGEGMSEDYQWTMTSGLFYQSEEYGNTVFYATPQNTNGEAYSLLGGFARFYNALCGTICIPSVAKTVTGGANFCETTTAPAGVSVSGTNCYPNNYSFAGGTINDRMKDEDFCNALTGQNFQGFLFEDPISRIGTTGNDAVLGQNSLYYDEANSVCSWLKLIPEETNNAYYSEQMGFVWLAPSSDGTPDLIVPWRTVANNGATDTDVPYWIDYELVPQGPEQTTAPFVFGGTAPDTSSWCESGTAERAPNGKSGDSGGVQPLTVWCPAQNRPVEVIQYHHSYILGGSDLGPIAAVVNESAVAESVQSSWFGSSAPGNGDAATTYNHVVGFAQCGSPATICEGAYIPSSYSGSLLTALQAVNTNCTDSTWCLPSGSVSTAINMTSAAFSPASTQSNCTDGHTCVPAHSAIFLTSQ